MIIDVSIENFRGRAETRGFGKENRENSFGGRRVATLTPWRCSILPMVGHGLKDSPS